jgi:hypothetical protein
MNKKNPAESYVINTRMPSRTMQKFFAVIKVVNAKCMADYSMTQEDIDRGVDLGQKIKRQMNITKDDRCLRSLDDLRHVQRGAILTAPKDLNQSGFTICERSEDVTLTSKDFGRGFIFYNVKALFGETNVKNPTEAMWKGIMQVLLEAWGEAEAKVIDPEFLNSCTKCPKKVIIKLRQWIYIRSTGYHPPERGATGKGNEATEKEKKWASEPFEDFEY